MITQIEPFEAKFEDVSIYFHKLHIQPMIETVTETEHRFSGTSGVYTFGMITHYYEKGKSLIGDFLVTFRNQVDHFDSLLLVGGTVSLSSDVDNSGKSVFCKFIQYMFEWTSQYILTNKLTDANAKPFVMPPFLYSKEQFNNIDD